MAKKEIIMFHEGPWTREEAQSHSDILYVFTDNTNRTSGKNPVDPESAYAKMYGQGLFYPGQTAAVLRGLDNAMPLTTQHWYDRERGLTREAGRWTDEDSEEFLEIISAELSRIRTAFAEGGYKTIMFPEGGVFDSKIANISEERCPVLHGILSEELDSFSQAVQQTPMPKAPQVAVSAVKPKKEAARKTHGEPREFPVYKAVLMSDLASSVFLPGRAPLNAGDAGAELDGEVLPQSHDALFVPRTAGGRSFQPSFGRITRLLGYADSALSRFDGSADDLKGQQEEAVRRFQEYLVQDRETSWSYPVNTFAETGQPSDLDDGTVLAVAVASAMRTPVERPSSEAGDRAVMLASGIWSNAEVLESMRILSSVLMDIRKGHFHGRSWDDIRRGLLDDLSDPQSPLYLVDMQMRTSTLEAVRGKGTVRQMLAAGLLIGLGAGQFEDSLRQALRVGGPQVDMLCAVAGAVRAAGLQYAEMAESAEFYALANGAGVSGMYADFSERVAARSSELSPAEKKQNRDAFMSLSAEVDYISRLLNEAARSQGEEGLAPELEGFRPAPGQIGKGNRRDILFGNGLLAGSFWLDGRSGRLVIDDGEYRDISVNAPMSEYKNADWCSERIFSHYDTLFPAGKVEQLKRKMHSMILDEGKGFRRDGNGEAVIDSDTGEVVSEELNIPRLGLDYHHLAEAMGKVAGPDSVKVVTSAMMLEESRKEAFAEGRIFVSASPESDYPARTEDNAVQSDVTIAMYRKITAGEALTAACAGCRDTRYRTFERQVKGKGTVESTVQRREGQDRYIPVQIDWTSSFSTREQKEDYLRSLARDTAERVLGSIVDKGLFSYSYTLTESGEPLPDGDAEAKKTLKARDMKLKEFHGRLADLRMNPAGGPFEEQAEALMKEYGVERSLNKSNKPLRFNIAGNGIATLSELGMDQEMAALFTRTLAESLREKGVRCKSVRSGGQTGFDITAIDFAEVMGAPCELHTPRNYKWCKARGVHPEGLEEYSAMLADAGYDIGRFVFYQEERKSQSLKASDIYDGVGKVYVAYVNRRDGVEKTVDLARQLGVDEVSIIDDGLGDGFADDLDSMCSKASLPLSETRSFYNCHDWDAQMNTLAFIKSVAGYMGDIHNGKSFLFVASSQSVKEDVSFAVGLAGRAFSDEGVSVEYFDTKGQKMSHEEVIGNAQVAYLESGRIRRNIGKNDLQDQLYHEMCLKCRAGKGHHKGY